MDLQMVQGALYAVRIRFFINKNDRIKTTRQIILAGSFLRLDEQAFIC